MDDGFEHFPAPVRWLLRSDFSTGAVLLGPLFLLWHGEWRACLRWYLPLALASLAAHGALSYGVAHRSALVAEISYDCILACLLGGLACNVWWSLHWTDSPRPAGRHWVAPLAWLALAWLGLDAAMRLGMVL